MLQHGIQIKKGDNKTYQCECKNSWNPSTCIC